MSSSPAVRPHRSWRWSINRAPQTAVRKLGQLASVLALAALVSGCRQDMHNQPKFYPQRSTTFFADGRSVRPQLEHTVARSQQHDDSFFYTGLVEGKEQDMLPFPATVAVLQRGEERYNVYCTPCHSRVGNGAGMIVQRGYKPAGTFHDTKRLAEPLSHYFYVISNGYGAMPDYSAQLTPADRWAVTAYIRALQLSQNARVADVPQGAPIHTLHQVAEAENLPASFAEPWTLPATAVTAMPATDMQGYPGGAAPQDAGNPPASKNLPSGGKVNGAPAGGPMISPRGAHPLSNPSLDRTLPSSSAPVGTHDVPQGGR